MTTVQSEFWRGQFGDEYLERNRYDWRVRKPFWSRLLDLTEPRTILEIGCNRGNNLLAIRELDDTIAVAGTDINAKALAEARAEGLSVMERDAREVPPASADLVFTSGVLIHIPPADLEAVMDAILAAAHRYVLAIEYPAESMMEIDYRGHGGRLWKGPYGRMYESKGLKLLETGVAQGWDRCAYWLLERR